MADFIRFKRQGRPPRGKRGSASIYVDETGAFKAVDETGGESDIGGGGGGSRPGATRLIGPFTFDHNDITFPADPSITLPGATNGVTIYTSINSNGIAFLNDGPNTSLTVDYDGGIFAYHVHLGTDSDGLVTSTANDVVAAFAALPPTAGDVLSLAPGNSGAGLVAETLGSDDFTAFQACFFDLPGAPVLDADTTIVAWIGRAIEAWVDLALGFAGVFPGGVPDYQIQSGNNGAYFVDVPLLVFTDGDVFSTIDRTVLRQPENAEVSAALSGATLTNSRPVRQTTAAKPRLYIASNDGVAPSAGAAVVYLLVAAP